MSEVSTYCPVCFRPYTLGPDGMIRDHFAKPFTLAPDKCEGRFQKPSARSTVVHLVPTASPTLPETLCCNAKPAKLPVFHRFSVDKNQVTCAGKRR